MIPVITPVAPTMTAPVEPPGHTEFSGHTTISGHTAESPGHAAESPGQAPLVVQARHPNILTLQPVSSHRKSRTKPPQLHPHFFHFVHVPKCGGTTFTTILRRASCRLLTLYSTAHSLPPSPPADCCTNPGYCENPNRLCASVSGCQNHLPQLTLLPPPTSPTRAVTMLRDPVARVVSAWFYRCHNPNRDCYNVRPEFCQEGQRASRKCGANYDGVTTKKSDRNGNENDPVNDDEWRKKVWEFEEYLTLPEYHNIFCRMFGGTGAGEFPYSNELEITDAVLARARSNLLSFDLVGLQELYEPSVRLLVEQVVGADEDGEWLVGLDEDVDVVKERGNDKIDGREELQTAVRDNVGGVRERIEKANWCDTVLFQEAKERLCNMVTEEEGGEFCKHLDHS